MRGLSRTWWRRAKKANQHEPVSMRFYNVWETVSRFAAENRTRDFRAAMTRRRVAHGSEGVMGLLDCATPYGLARWQRPAGVGESGGLVGTCSAFGSRVFVA